MNECFNRDSIFCSELTPLSLTFAASQHSLNATTVFASPTTHIQMGITNSEISKSTMITNPSPASLYLRNERVNNLRDNNFTNSQSLAGPHQCRDL
jgi:hypothetical protein